MSLNECPTCGGNGTENGSQCSLCLGGGWLVVTETQKYCLQLPPLYDPLEIPTQKNMLRNLKIGSGLLALLASIFLYILISEGSIWQPGMISIGFGTSTLGFISLFTLCASHTTKHSSLYDLDKALYHPDSAYDLHEYTSTEFHKIIQHAAVNASLRGADAIEASDIGEALLKDPHIAVMLGRLEIEIETDVEGGEQTKKSELRALPFSRAARTLLLGAVDEALTIGSDQIDRESLTLAFLSVQYGKYYQPFHEIIAWYRADEQRHNLLSERSQATHGHGYMNQAWTALPTPNLDLVSTDLTKMALSGAIHTSGIREDETKQAIELLESRARCVLFLGNSNLEQTQMLDALALGLLSDDLPESVRDTRLVSLSVDQLRNAGTQANLVSLLDEAATAENVILAIPQLEALAEGFTSAHPPLETIAHYASQRMLKIVATSSERDYQKFIEPEASLKESFEIIRLGRLSNQEVAEYLKAKTPLLEHTYNVTITLPALVSIAALSNQYLQEEQPEAALHALEKACQLIKSQNRHWVPENVTAAAVESLARVPVSAASGDEAQTIINLEDELRKHIVGQTRAIEAVSSAIRRARSGLHKSNRPLASLLFVGRTGMGKTELAKAIASSYFKDASAFVRFDLSEYQDPDSLYRLIGPPTQDSQAIQNGGLLTQTIQNHPFCLILLDELEKADINVRNLFLQLLDDGRLTDNTGTTLSFANAIIVATSNVGSKNITGDETEEALLRELEVGFTPELLNRFDSIVPFTPLNEEEVVEIGKRFAQEIVDEATSQNIQLRIDPAVISQLATKAYDPEYGARPIRRAVRQKLEDCLAKVILESGKNPPKELRITLDMLD